MLVLMSPESLVPEGHPARAIKRLADECLAELSPVFDGMYAETWRPSIPPERLLKSIVSFRQACLMPATEWCHGRLGGDQRVGLREGRL